MKDDKLKSKLSKALKEDMTMDTTIVAQQTTVNNNLSEASISVMESYQNANKWLDTIKEDILMDHGCVFFSNYIHNLAHTMPVRFDKFGDILHTIDMKIIYPATAYIEREPTSILDSIDQTISILDAICDALKLFISISESEGCKAAAISAEDLLIDISNEYPALYRMKRAYNVCGDNIKFDKWVAQYVNNMNSLI